ncbi:MAG TPA: amino acid ABC transporter permease [Feifaniaceae bacterium]|nr:amino acid ABC transporter permease [Feifaniaceae bacterium]
MWDNFGQQLYNNIIANNRWMLYVEGLGNTLLITLGAAVLGILLGALVAICKVYALHNKALRPLELICDVYLTVIRGTPVMVQLLIFAFVIFASVPFEYNIYVAILAFGINSGAYVAEIMRAGIQAVNRGQTEAGRSLGLSNGMTMRHIVLPQAIKNILPALANEAIVLLKETAVVGYIAMNDLTYMSMMIRTRTYSVVPLLVTALIYLLVVMLMTWGLRKLERRLSKSDHR